MDKRIEQHNNSKWGAHYTKIRRPVKLKYSETFNNLKEARRREAEIKGWSRIKKQKLITKEEEKMKKENWFPERIHDIYKKYQKEFEKYGIDRLETKETDKK